MISYNESCGAEQISISYLTCLLYVLEEWTGVEHLEEYLNYLKYLTWLFMPLLIVFLLPLVIPLLLYISIFFLYIYKRKADIKEAYLNDFWDGARQVLATIWYAHARIWNGYELHGLENLPDGPAILIFYHGPSPMDMFYTAATLLIRQKRPIHGVFDNFVLLLPGMKLFLEVFRSSNSSQEECRKVLKNGGQLVIAPGGLREALFSDENYTILWRKRKGFAQVAIDMKVPIIPVFTQNVRESIRIIGGRIKLLRTLYEYHRLPLFPMYGNFPVKLRTYFGDPIPYDPNITAEELTEKVKNALQNLINKHQKIPGNVWRALMERVITEKKDDK